MIRVLVAEDSVTSRELLVAILQSTPDLKVVGEARNGVEAVEMTKRLRPDVVTMDIQMPRMDGFEATKRIMIEAPTPIVIVSGASNFRDVEVSLQALRAGALTVLRRPAGPGREGFPEEAQSFVAAVRAMSQVKVVRRWAEQPHPPPPAPRRGATPLRAVAIAASTGGPAALAQLVSCLPSGFSVPILLVQHMASGFIEGFASWLGRAATIEVKVAEHGETLAPRTLYLAPDDRHLRLSQGSTILLSRDAPVDGFRPAATVLFDSVASVFGSAMAAVVLTGMGRDGVEGLRAVRANGGRIIAQDRASAVVFGMPGAAIEAGLADEVLPLVEIGPRLVALSGEGARR